MSINKLMNSKHFNSINDMVMRYPHKNHLTKPLRGLASDPRGSLSQTLHGVATPWKRPGFGNPFGRLGNIFGRFFNKPRFRDPTLNQGNHTGFGRFNPGATNFQPGKQIPDSGFNYDKPVISNPNVADNFRTLEAGINSQGNLSVNTQDGYQISCSGDKQTWYITDPSGKSTKIWGDPHVVESDGDTWDFQKQSSFLFGNNKVTVKTVPANNGTSAHYTSEITIYNGQDRITISGIDTDNPTITGMGHDGKIHDFLTADGDHYRLAKEANGDDAWIQAR